MTVMQSKHIGAEAEAFIEQAPHARWHEAIPGEKVSIRVPAARTGGRYSVMETIASPGAAAPLHTHAEDEFFWVLSGRPTFALGEELFEAAPGSVVNIPAGVPHAWKNATDRDVRMIAVFTPGGVEELFTKLGGLSPVEIAEMAAGYGTMVLGPPIGA